MISNSLQSGPLDRLCAIILAIGLCAIPSIVVAQNSTSNRRGTLISVEPVEIMSVGRARAFAAEYPGSITIETGADMFRVTYWSRLSGRPERASGLLALPSGAAQVRGIYACFRGTNTTRQLAPSELNRIDGNHEAALYAGNGFAVIVPDYFGMGASTVPQAYLLVQPQVDASIDMLRAVQEYLEARGFGRSHDLVMMGFSQGGQVVAGVHRELERRPLAGIRLKGSVGIAGAYDLRGASVALTRRTCPTCVGYIAWATSSFSHYLGCDLGDVLRPEHVGSIPPLFDGSHMPHDIGMNLPGSLSDLLTPEFHADLVANRDNWFTRALDANQTWRWVPRAPFRAYFGEADLDVPLASSLHFYNYAHPRGGHVTLHSMGDVDHMGSARKATPEAWVWFTGLVPANRPN